MTLVTPVRGSGSQQGRARFAQMRTKLSPVDDTAAASKAWPALQGDPRGQLAPHEGHPQDRRFRGFLPLSTPPPPSLHKRPKRRLLTNPFTVSHFVQTLPPSDPPANAQAVSHGIRTLERAVSAPFPRTLGQPAPTQSESRLGLVTPPKPKGWEPPADRTRADPINSEGAQRLYAVGVTS